VKRTTWLMCSILVLAMSALTRARSSTLAPAMSIPPIVPSGTSPLGPFESEADKLFPKPPVMLEYERVFDSLKTGKISEELPKVAILAKQPVYLGSAEAWANDPQVYYEAYTCGRLIPAQAVIRKVWAVNGEYADKLGKEGRRTEAISVLILNLSMAGQIVHIEPSDMASMLSGHGLWQWTWHQLSKQLDVAGDHARAKRAESCAHQAKVYTQLRAAPVIAYGGRRYADFDRRMKRLPKSRRAGFNREKSLEFIHEDSLAAVKLIKQWDTEVDTVACKQLIKELEKMAQQD
jgi:hypothetical protein